jgi:hypothetical protein
MRELNIHTHVKNSMHLKKNGNQLNEKFTRHIINLYIALKLLNYIPQLIYHKLKKNSKHNILIFVLEFLNGQGPHAYNIFVSHVFPLSLPWPTNFSLFSYTNFVMNFHNWVTWKSKLLIVYCMFLFLSKISIKKMGKKSCTSIEFLVRWSCFMNFILFGKFSRNMSSINVKSSLMMVH